MLIILKNGNTIKNDDAHFDAYACIRYDTNFKLRGTSVITYEQHAIPLSNIEEIIIEKAKEAE